MEFSTDPRYSTANRDLLKLQDQNKRLKDELHDRTYAAEQKNQELEAAKAKLAELQRMCLEKEKELDEVKSMFGKHYEIEHDQY